MKKNITLFVIYFFITNILNAQIDKKRDYVWFFGFQTNKRINTIDFNKKYPEIKNTDKAPDLNISKNIAMMCDTAGKLQAFTNGCKIYDQNFEIMENGNGISPSFFTNPANGFDCVQSGVHEYQNAMMLPKPENDSIVYCINSIEQLVKNKYQLTDTMRLSIINMKANNGLGKVIAKNKGIYLDTIYGLYSTAVRHSNGKDWWLVFPTDNMKGFDNRLVTVLITKDSIYHGMKQEVGFLHNWTNGQVLFSPNGKKYASYFVNFGVTIANFDRSNGAFGSTLFIKINGDKSTVGGISFSPNNRFLYVSTPDNLIQVDLGSSNIKSSMDTVAKWDGYKEGPFTSEFGRSLLAPDCKIYINPSSIVDVLSIINYPNRKGKACKVEQQIRVPNTMSYAFPNYPVYRLGKEGDNFSPCDSTISTYITGLGEVNEKPITAAIYPNPTTDYVNVDLYGFLQSYTQGTWQLHSGTGQLVSSYPVLSGHSEYQFSLPDLPNGLYVWHLVLDGSVRGNGKLVILE